MPTKYILVINAGSSSVKFKLFDFNYKVISEGLVEKIGLAGSFISYKFNRVEKKRFSKVKDHYSALQLILGVLEDYEINFDLIKKVGHRVVHGGEKYYKPTLINKRVLIDLKKLSKLAPLHNPNNVAGIEACLEALPKAKNYAVFDTSFYNKLPDYAYLYPLPYRLYKKYGLRRYGFHGISHEYVSGVAAGKISKKKPNLIVCHLGSGCSVTAIQNGVAIDTSMGFTPLEGLMMTTRTGDIDPSIALFLAEQKWSLDRIQKLFNFESGLLGVSGMKDMRDIMIANGYKIPGYTTSLKLNKDQKKLAKIALQMFVYRVRKYIGAYSAVLGQVDALVFTAGIGERNKDIRNLIVNKFPNKPKVLVVPTNEELMIAKSI